MKHDVAFPRRILLTVLVVGVLSVYPLAVYANREMIYGIIAGCAVSVVNVLAGYLSIEYAFDRSNTAFLRIILGGMGIRLLVVAAAIVLLLKVFHMDIYGLVFSFFFFYIVFAVLEILFLNRKISLRKTR
jgi:hypothetical protein